MLLGARYVIVIFTLQLHSIRFQTRRNIKIRLGVNIKLRDHSFFIGLACNSQNSAQTLTQIFFLSFFRMLFHSIPFQLIHRRVKLLLLLFIGWRLPTRMQSLLMFPSLQKMPIFIKGKFSFHCQLVSCDTSLVHCTSISLSVLLQNHVSHPITLLFQITIDWASQASHLATFIIQRVDWWKRPKCPKSISQTLLVFSRATSMDCVMYKSMMNWN